MFTFSFYELTANLLGKLDDFIDEDVLTNTYNSKILLSPQIVRFWVNGKRVL